ncbi:MAG: GH116 family glycosyl hydrolase [Gemmatimonadota bacterium]
MSKPYSKKELAGTGKQRTFTGDQLQQIAFPLGGLGAGCLHLGGAGNLQDFCLFNRPSFGHSPMTFAAVWAREKGRRDGVMRVLEGPVQSPHIYDQGRFGNGGLASGHEGLPHMAAARFAAEFPFATVQLSDPDLPVAARLEAWSPFVPGDGEASGLPAAFLTYRLENRRRRAVQVQFSFHAQFPGLVDDLAGHRVRQRRDSGAAGVYFDSDRPAADLHRVSVAVVSPRAGQKADCAWFRGGWWDALTVLTNRLLVGRLQRQPESPPVSGGRRARFGATLFWDLELKPGEAVEIPLVYCWHAPNTELRVGRREDAEPAAGSTGRPGMARTYRPHYATRFADAWEVAAEALGQYDDLQRRSRSFQRHFFASSLPDYALEAVSANLAILKSPTVLWQEDGTLWCWEGSSYAAGCCAGSCTHVWNYAQAIPYLFPDLERTLRDQELQWSMDRRGHVTFRAALPTGQATHTMHAASDGQLGGIMKVYRDWQIGGGDAWLRPRYLLARRSLEYCIRTWDPAEQGALLEPHHNTYDIEFWGADGMCTSFYLGALRAMAALAEHLGQADDARRYAVLADRGRAFCDRSLWNGEYYYQRVEWKKLKVARSLRKWLAGYSEEALALFAKEGPKYQYGTGCVSDGVMGQWYTTMLGLPDALTRSRARRHLAAIFKHNFRRSLRGHANPQRPGYALNDEPGTLLCSWPRGGKPTLPFVYSDEVWTGIEYQVASHMIYEGLVAEGLSVVRAVRQRYDGRVRNPWNEYECGNYYARAMASYGVLLALSGCRYRAPAAQLEVAPRVGQPRGRFFFATGGAWGTVEYDRRAGRIRVAVEEGQLAVERVVVAGDASRRQRRQRLPDRTVVTPGKPLTVRLEG